jgi:hypothetical protein
MAEKNVEVCKKFIKKVGWVVSFYNSTSVKVKVKW